MTDLTAALVERDGACRARDAQLILGPCEGPSETVAIHSTLETAPLLHETGTTKWSARLCRHHREQLGNREWTFLALDDEGMDGFVPISRL